MIKEDIMKFIKMSLVACMKFINIVLIWYKFKLRIENFLVLPKSIDHQLTYIVFVGVWNLNIPQFPQLMQSLNLN